MTQSDQLPEGICSLLDTDLYKLTMQSCVLKYFPDSHVTYKFTNRTPHLKLTREALEWLGLQIEKLGNLRVTASELEFLRTTCPYLNSAHLRFLSTFHFKPQEQIEILFTADNDTGADSDTGAVSLSVSGLWVETILYEIPLLALISEAYFKFVDRDWDYEGQQESAKEKGRKLLEGGCVFSEFGTRRRRDYYTQTLVMKGLMEAQEEAKSKGWTGKLSGTSNVHFAMQFGIPPVGTVAHEWFMGVASITNDYENANEIALRYWVGTFGQGVLSIALTDTFGTPAFLKAFKKKVPAFTTPLPGMASASSASHGDATVDTPESLSKTETPISAPVENDGIESENLPTYADVFAGVRQDSGDPREFVKLIKAFYGDPSMTAKKAIVFSDSLNVDKCFIYKSAAEEAGFQATFGVGTFLTNDFERRSSGSGEKSVPMNIVIKLSEAGGRPAIKISDNIGKNTGDEETVKDVKRRLGYEEKTWEDGDETKRW